MPGKEVKPPYTIEDMAVGTVGLLGALSKEPRLQIIDAIVVHTDKVDP